MDDHGISVAALETKSVTIDSGRRPLGRPSGHQNYSETWRLRNVPSHWEVGRLKRICRFAYGDSLSDGTRRKGNVPVFGSNGPVGAHISANTKAPCIIVGRKGSFGKVNYSCTPVFAIDTTFFIDARYTSADIRWLYYLLGWLRLDDISRDSAVPGLNREESYRRLIPIPSLAEQTSIANFLDHSVDRIRRYVSAKRKLIALLNEQKRVMISQVVTGQIDVRTGNPMPPTNRPAPDRQGRYRRTGRCGV